MWTIDSKQDGMSRRHKHANLESELQTIDEMDFDVNLPKQILRYDEKLLQDDS